MSSKKVMDKIREDGFRWFGCILRNGEIETMNVVKNMFAWKESEEEGDRKWNKILESDAKMT